MNRANARRSGILVLEKGPGLTSFQVIERIRRILRGPKLGHGGTLDPPATGVLPVLVGEATKLAPYLLDHDKEYLATIRFGVLTDTQDLSGRIVEEREVPGLSQETVQAALARFTGVIQQVPPMFSALHYGGRRLYELARSGQEVVREPRDVIVHQITLEELALPRLVVRVSCGKGTYIRTLAQDLGMALGCGGALEQLVRTRVGPFSLEEAISWSELETLQDPDDLWRRLLPLDAALTDWPRLRLSEALTDEFLHGRPCALPQGRWMVGQKVSVYDAFGEFFAVGRVTASSLTPERIFHVSHPRARALPTR
jgi:tRNA pseudouridine55 synthase